MKENDKLSLRLKNSIEYLNSVAERLKDRPEEKETVKEIQQVIFHLQELLNIECNNEIWKKTKYIFWIVKAIGLIKFFKSLIDSIDY